MKIVVTSLFITLSLPLWGGGGWPVGKKKSYFKLGQNWIVSSKFYNPSGTIIPIRTVGLYTTSFYGEYGITDRLTGIIYFPFFVRGVLNEERFSPSGTIVPGEMVNAPGDTDLSVKYSFFSGKPVVASVTVTLGLPIGTTRGGESGVLQTGDGEFNQLVRIDASTSFHPVPLYVSAYVGYNNRTKNFSDEFRYGIEAGYTFFKRFTVIGKLIGVKSFFNGGDVVAENGIFSNNTEFLSPSIEAGYEFKKRWGVSVSGGFAYSARNILASPNWGAGAYLKL